MAAPDPKVSEAQAPPRRRRRWLRRLGTALVGTALVVLAGGAVFFALAAHTNKHSATQWQRRAAKLNHLLAARTAELNQRDTALAKTSRELTGLNQQVSSMRGKLSSVANEKAQVEDQRGLLVTQTAELTQIANEQSTCSQGLSTLLQDFAAEDYVDVDANASSVGQSCQQAQTDFQTFEASVGQ